MDGETGRQIDGRMNGTIDWWQDGWMNGETVRQKDEWMIYESLVQFMN